MSRTETIHLIELVDRVNTRWETPIWQRNLVWNKVNKDKYLMSLYDGTYIPPIIIAELPDGRQLENDGHQRDTVAVQLLNNKIKLPTMIPHEEGGGKYLKEAPIQTQEKMKYCNVEVTYVPCESEEEAQKMFINLQRGIPLTNGEIIHGSMGYHYDKIEELIKTHKIIPYIKSKRFAEYRVITGCYLCALGITTVVNKSKEIEFVDEGISFDRITPEVSEYVNNCLDRIVLMLEYGNHHNISHGRVILLMNLFQKDDSVLQADPNDLGEFYGKYYSNISLVNDFRGKSMDSDDVNGYKDACSAKYSNKAVMGVLLKHIYSEWKKFLKNEMVTYSKEMLEKLVVLPQDNNEE